METQSLNAPVASLSDDELLESREVLETLRKNLHDQRMAWEAGDLIGYDQDWAGRLRGKIAYTREELRTVKTELRRRGLMPPLTVQKPTPESRKWLNARYEALEEAIAQMLPRDDMMAIKGLAANIYQEMWDAAERNRATNGTGERDA